MFFRRFFYNILFTFGMAFTWPYFLWRMRKRGNFAPFFGERLSFYRPEVRQKLRSLRRPMWIHAVSVGEVMLARVLIRELRQLNPELQVLLTVTTQTGRQVASPLVDERTALIYTPVDFPFIIPRAFDRIQPGFIILVESEVWPNMMWEARRRGVPVFMVNARLSQRSEKRYRQFSSWVSPLLYQLQWIGVQTQEDILRLAGAGFPPHKLFLTGSMKFDVAELTSHNENLAEMIRKSLEWQERNPILLGGSTHPGEEEILIRTYRRLKEKHPRLKLILAPRHAERAGQIASLCQEANLSCVRRSILNGKPPETTPEVMVLDTTGELRSLYPLGKIIFMGKSLVGQGGQNFIEAARFGRAVVFGPNMQNFVRLVEIFQQKDAIRQVRNEEKLYQTFQELLDSPSLCQELEQRAAETFRQNLGAARRTAEFLEGNFEKNLKTP